MKPKDKYRMKKKIAAGIALLLAVVMVLSFWAMASIERRNREENVRFAETA